MFRDIDKYPSDFLFIYCIAARKSYKEIKKDSFMILAQQLKIINYKHSSLVLISSL